MTKHFLLSKGGRAFLFFACLGLVSSCGLIKNSKDSGGASEAPVDSGNSGNSGNNSGGTITASYGYLFPTTSTMDGAFDYTGSAPDITIADGLCATEASSRNLNGVFKAVLSLSGTRQPTSHWVLKNSAEYRRPDNTVIGTTNANGTFDFPLTAPITANSTTVWTGMNSTLGPDSASCNTFSYNVSPTEGKYGDLSAVTSDAFSKGNNFCSQSNALLCAEMIKQTLTLPAQAAYRRVFPSLAAMLPGTGLLGADGALRFDQQCQADANTKNISDSGKTTYKALMMANTTSNGVRRRVACLTAYCGNGPGEAVNWVLEANTEYRREDGTTVIATTSANAIFDFPLTNSFTGVNETYWTGFTDTWATATDSVGASCNFFQSKTITDDSYVGNGSAIDATAVNTSNLLSCAQTRKILCVEQRRTQNVFVSYPGYN